MNTASDYERVLEFWFGPIDASGLAQDSFARRWFMSDPAFDAELRALFLEDHRAAAAGERESWRASARGRLALLIVLDQFSRNMFHGSAQMFAQDAQALALATAEIASGHLHAFATDERLFVYMPLVHSEQLALQERAVELFARLRDELSDKPRERVALSHEFAIRHRDIIARFGRFPHRNALLGRASTPEELAFLAQPGSSF